MDDKKFLNLGVSEDTRSEAEKARDYKHEELAGAVTLDWRVKKQSEWKSYTLRDQDGSLSCVGQANAKAGEILTGKVLSAHPIYRLRANFPSGGMWLQNSGQIFVKSGTTLELLDVSQKIGEAEMNRDITVDTPLKPKAYVMVNPKNIDAIAEAVELYKHCTLVFHANRKEYDDVPVYNPKLQIDIGHAICAVDYMLWNGEKAILVEDSWGHATTLGNGGQRIITESYLKARFSDAMYQIWQDDIQPEKPSHKFVTPINFGMKKNKDVIALQDILKYEGFFPKEIPSTGNYLQITAHSLLKWQKAHDVAPIQELEKLAGKYVGPKTRAMLNQLYS